MHRDQANRDGMMHSTTLKQKYDPIVNIHIWNLQRFPFTEQTFNSNALKTAQ